VSGREIVVTGSGGVPGRDMEVVVGMVVVIVVVVGLVVVVVVVGVVVVIVVVVVVVGVVVVIVVVVGVVAGEGVVKGVGVVLGVADHPVSSWHCHSGQNRMSFSVYVYGPAKHGHSTSNIRHGKVVIL
jgi:hypothetical protein